MQAALWTGCKNGEATNGGVRSQASIAPKPEYCDPVSVLKTPALYLKHVADEDKHISPIVLAIGSPTLPEYRCAAPDYSINPYRRTYILTNEEFAKTAQATDGFKEAKPQGPEEFRYVLVRESGNVSIGILDRDQSKALFATLGKYFKNRQPEVYAALVEADRF